MGSGAERSSAFGFQVALSERNWEDGDGGEDGGDGEDNREEDEGIAAIVMRAAR